jgi:hypothetical protein
MSLESSSSAGAAPRLAGELRFARMPGSSIAAPDALGWVTDFLNAAYFARPEGERDVDDLRLAFTVLTTAWARRPARRLHAADLAAFHRTFALRRLRARPRFTLARDELLEGGAALLGDWFATAADRGRLRAHGVAFPDEEARDAFDPSVRLRHAALGRLTPPRAEEADQVWHTYPAVRLGDPGRAVGLLRDPSRWPDAGTEGGRFTALRPGGLLGQTFEIEVNARPAPQVPLFTRGYVTCTALLETEPALDTWAQQLNAAVGAAGPDGVAPFPDTARPKLGIELTTHDGHFLGRAISRLVVYEEGGTTWIRDVGSWDPLPWYLAHAYAVAGRRAQAAFWGAGPAKESMLTRIAALTASPA